MSKLSRVITGGDEEQSKHREDWLQDFRGCLQDIGGTAYDHDRVLEMYVAGESAADAAGNEMGEEICGFAE